MAEYFLPPREEVYNANPDLLPEQVDRLFDGLGELLPYSNLASERVEDGSYIEVCEFLEDIGEQAVYLMLYERTDKRPGTVFKVTHWDDAETEEGETKLILDSNGVLSFESNKAENISLFLAVTAVSNVLPQVRDAARQKTLEWEAQRERVRQERQAARDVIEPQLEVANFSDLIPESLTVAKVKQMLVESEVPEAVQEFIDTKYLYPQHSQRFSNDTVCHYSPVFVDGMRPKVIAYFERYDKLDVQVFYFSNSQAVWRWLPGCDPDAEGWYCKGQLEEALNLPRSVQQALAKLMAKPLMRLDHQNVTDFIESLVPKVTKGQADTYPILSKFFKYDIYEVWKRPETNPPDFSECIAQWSIKSDLYGDVTIQVFKSEDGQMEYGFARTTNGRVWVAFIERADAALRPNGLRDEFFFRANPPAIEHIPKHEQGNYIISPQTQVYQPPDRFLPLYRDQFKQVVSNEPLIQRYYETLTPDEVDWGDLVPAGEALSPHMLRFIDIMRRPEVANNHLLTPRIRELARGFNGMSSEQQEIMESSLRRFLFEVQAEQYAAAHPEENAFRTDVPPDIRKYGTQEHQAFNQMLETLHFTLRKVREEEYDTSIHYHYWESPVFPGIQLIVAQKDEDIINWNIHVPENSQPPDNET